MKKTRIPRNVYPGAILRLMAFGKGEVRRLVTHGDTGETVVEARTLVDQIPLTLSLTYASKVAE